MRRGKVDGFRNVEPIVESGMIGPGKSNDEFSYALIHAIHLNVLLLQVIRGSQGDEIMKKVWSSLEEIWSCF